MIPRPEPVPAPFVSGKINLALRINVTESAMLSSVSMQVSDLNISSNCGNELNALDLNRFDSLQSIEIGDDCFGSVQSFQIDGLNRLKTIKIGNNSFTQNKEENWKSDIWHIAIKKSDNKLRSFHILNCESLESIQIDKYSFNDFAGQFELRNLPNLVFLTANSYNFYFGSFVIRGIYTTILK